MAADTAADAPNVLAELSGMRERVDDPVHADHGPEATVREKGLARSPEQMGRAVSEISAALP